MKNFLAPVLENKAVTTVTKYCTAHKSAIIAGGTIGSSLATTAIVFKNSPLIHDIIWNTREAIAAANNDEEKKCIYKAALKELAVPVAEIIIFQSATIALTIYAKKDSDKKEQRIAELSSTVAAATQIIDQYETFKREAEAELGEKKLTKVREKITESRGPIIVDNIEPASGEFIFRDVYCGHVFTGSKDTVRLACERLSNEIKDSMDCYAVLNGEYYQTLKVDCNTMLGDKFGYIAENDRLDIIPQFVSAEVELPDGSKVPGYDIYLYPEPEYVDI